MADAVYDDDLDVQRAEHRQINEKIAEILIGDDGAIDGHDEDLTMKTWNVLEDSTQIRRLDRGR